MRLWTRVCDVGRPFAATGHSRSTRASTGRLLSKPYTPNPKPWLLFSSIDLKSQFDGGDDVSHNECRGDDGDYGEAGNDAMVFDDGIVECCGCCDDEDIGWWGLCV